MSCSRGRAQSWQDDISAGCRHINLYRSACDWLSYPAGERPASIPSWPKCTDVMVIAGLALRCAAQELDEQIDTGRVADSRTE